MPRVSGFFFQFALSAYPRVLAVLDVSGREFKFPPVNCVAIVPDHYEAIVIENRNNDRKVRQRYYGVNHLEAILGYDPILVKTNMTY